MKKIIYFSFDFIVWNSEENLLYSENHFCWSYCSIYILVTVMMTEWCFNIISQWAIAILFKIYCCPKWGKNVNMGWSKFILFIKKNKQWPHLATGVTITIYCLFVRRSSCRIVLVRHGPPLGNNSSFFAQNSVFLYAT